MSRNRNQNRNNNSRRIGYNAEPEHKPIILTDGMAPQIIIPVTREEYLELLNRSLKLDLVASMIENRDNYMDVRPLQKLLGLIDVNKEDDA